MAGTYYDLMQKYATTTTTTREGTQKVVAPQEITQSLGNFVVDMSVIPYMREQRLIGVIKGMKPNTGVSVYMDADDVSGYVQAPTMLYLYDNVGNFHDKYDDYEIVDVWTSSAKTTKLGTCSAILQCGDSWSVGQDLLYVLFDENVQWTADCYIEGRTSGAVASVDTFLTRSGRARASTSTSITLGVNAMPITNIYNDFSVKFLDSLATYGSNIVFPNSQIGSQLVDNDLDDVLQMYTIKIVGGTGAGQSRTITAYNGSTKVATISSAWTTNPDTTSIYSIGALQTDDFGYAVGRIILPAATYKTGNKRFTVTDSINPSLSSTHAEATFVAQGIQQTTQETSVTVMVPTIKTQTVTQSKPSTTTYTTQVVQKNAEYVPAPAVTQKAGGCGGGCFTPSTMVLMANGKKKKISDIKVGDVVYNHDKTATNIVMFVEKVIDTKLEKLYSPTGKGECFATINHPLYIDGKLSSPIADKVYEYYPWLGQSKSIADECKYEDTKGEFVYNLWLNGDGTYTVNGFGTTSIIGDGGILRLLIERGEIAEERASDIMITVTSVDKYTSHGAYTMNNLCKILDMNIINKILVRGFKDDTNKFTQKAVLTIFKLVGLTTLPFKKV
jgi:hypothetical protein